MNAEEIKEIILKVIKENEDCLGGGELSLQFPVEVSAKHVHLTRDDVERLFGPGYELTPKRPLSQTGQFLSEERVTLVTSKGSMEKVAVLGPIRSRTQVELSAQDARQLGINAPLRLSGNLEGAGDVGIVGPKGMIYAKGSVIIAKAHIHMKPDEARSIAVSDGQHVRVRIHGERSVTFEDVIVRVSDTAALAMHMDFDEANACLLPDNAMARMSLAGGIAENCGQMQTSTEYSEVCTEKVITEGVARKLAEGKKQVRICKKSVITPLAKDVFLHMNTEIVRV